MNFDQIPRIKIIPINNLIISVTGLAYGSNPAKFFNLADGSSWSVEDISEDDDRAGTRKCALFITIKAIVLENDWQNWELMLLELTQKKLNSASIVLKPEAGQVGGAEMWVTTNGQGTATPILADWNIRWRADSAQPTGAQMTFDLTAIYTLDASVLAHGGVFNQVAGFAAPQT